MATDPLDAVIGRLTAGTISSPELEQQLRLSQSTIGRLLRRLVDEGRVLRMGATRGARYALVRQVEGIGSAWPLHQVTSAGKIEELGTLHALAADQYYFAPLPTISARGFAWDEVSGGIPYFLQDQRPGGFSGRAVPARYPELRLPQRVIDWNDDHYLRYLTQRGAECVGDLILGVAALDDYLRIRHTRVPIPEALRSQRYPELVSIAMEGGLSGSSAHGEHPKFTALLETGSGPRHVIVKFSPPANTPTGLRWSDLLLAEHHAHVVLAECGVHAARSNVFQFDGRTYLEMDRFDRNGLEGRCGVTSLLAIDTQLYGQLDNWIAAADRLHRDRRIDAATLEQIRLIATFGALIANTDRHFGNLAFLDDYRGTFSLAPVYDMLPMLFAPEHEQLVQRVFEPPAMSAQTLHAYEPARSLAASYWQRIAGDSRVSEDFRRIAAQCESRIAG